MKPKREDSACLMGRGWERGPLIGCGGFGSVYLATAKEPMSHSYPPVMAVKSAKFSQCSELVSELLFLKQLKECPQIIKCYGRDTTRISGGVLMYDVLMEYASGGSLMVLIKKFGRHGLPEEIVRKLVFSILLGIKYLHGRGIIHCDLKPDNILLVQNSNGFLPKICDFGLAKWANEPKRNVRGTTLYLSPESVVDREQEAPSDIWALGCIVFMLLTGRSPWAFCSTKEELFSRITYQSPVIPTWMSRRAKDFLQRCFVRNPVERWTAEMLLQHPFMAEPSDAPRIPLPCSELVTRVLTREVEPLKASRVKSFGDDFIPLPDSSFSQEGEEDGSETSFKIRPAFTVQPTSFIPIGTR